MGSRTARGLLLAAALVAWSCGQAPSDAGRITLAELLSIVEHREASRVTCPDYLPPPPESRGSRRDCFRSSDGGADFARGLVGALPAVEGRDLNTELKWDLVEKAELRDGCQAEVINNLRPYALRDDAAEDRRGWVAFWVVDRSACDDGTLIVLTSWPHDGSS